MITLKDIINFVKNNNFKIYGEYKNFIITNIAILNNPKELSKNTLYLTDDINLNYFKQCNILTITKDIYESSSLLQLESDLTLEKIYIIISEFLMEKQKLYIKKYTIFDSINNDFEINEILNIAENYLNNPILILDTSYKILGLSKLATLLHDSINSYNESYYLVSEIIENIKEDNCMDTIYNSTQAFFHSSKEKLIFCGIKVNNITTAYICVLKKYRDFNCDDLSLVNTLSKTLSIQIQKDNLFINSSGLEEEYYLIDLLENKVEDINHLKERLSQTNFKIKDNLFLVSVPFKQIYKDYRHNFGLKQLINNVKSILLNSIATYINNKIIFLVSTNSEKLFSIDTESQFLNFLKLNNLKAGISMSFENILETKEFYKQSINTLNIVEHLNSNDYIFYFEDYLEYYWFNLSLSNEENQINIKNLIHPFIKKIIITDKKHNTELLKTLTTYLDNNRNSNIASKVLKIHNSTFFYRFHKIEALLNISLTDSDVLFKLELSLKLLKYIEKSNTNY
ncbi:MAG: helix-turn-helix domain-containing protein [Clostridium perfringens]|nr:helix-turn-helix domain-containing protein [Clostridium perfringens]